jgi:hypothetical protein
MSSRLTPKRLFSADRTGWDVSEHKAEFRHTLRTFNFSPNGLHGVEIDRDTEWVFDGDRSGHTILDAGNFRDGLLWKLPKPSPYRFPY